MHSWILNTLYSIVFIEKMCLNWLKAELYATQIVTITICVVSNYLKVTGASLMWEATTRPNSMNPLQRAVRSHISISQINRNASISVGVYIKTAYMSTYRRLPTGELSTPAKHVFKIHYRVCDNELFTLNIWKPQEWLISFYYNVHYHR